jgi:hypothetical protein
MAAGRLAATMLALGLSLEVGADPARLHRYTVSIDEPLTLISVRACFDGRPPLYLVSESLDAAEALADVAVEGTRKHLEPNGAELNLGALPDGSCVSYRTDLTRATGRHERSGGPLRRAGHDLITELGIWFWRPESLASDEDIEVRFDLPAGISASAPWRPVIAADGARAYRVGHSPTTGLRRSRSAASGDGDRGAGCGAARRPARRVARRGARLRSPMADAGGHRCHDVVAGVSSVARAARRSAGRARQRAGALGLCAARRGAVRALLHQPAQVAR